MRKNNKKGFTIVELVIVIAVIAILAAVLIPTFAGMISKANESKALQEAKNAYTNDLALLDGQATNYMNLDYKEAAYTAVADDVTSPVAGETYFTRSEEYKEVTVTSNTFAELKTTLYIEDGGSYTAVEETATFDETTTYYVKEDVYTAVELTEFESDTTYYYRKSICAGTFSGENYTTYTYEAEGSEYKCTYTNGSWDVEKKN